MRIRFISTLLLVALIYGCDDAPPSSVVTDPLPEPEPSVHIIDTYYYTQFTWGKASILDTVTIEIPDYAEEWGELEYLNTVMELRSERIKDYNKDDSTKIDTVGWSYAPATVMYPYNYVQWFAPDESSANKIVEYRNEPDYTSTVYDLLGDPLDAPASAQMEKSEAYKNIFWITFPHRTSDTLQYWDIQDYLNNPSLVEGSIPWGRVGNNNEEDSVWNEDTRSGVVLHYMDERGEIWESDNHPTFQPFGYFQIESIEQNFKDSQSYFIITGQMAARLYNSRSEYKELRNGIFRVKVMDDILLSEQPK